MKTREFLSLRVLAIALFAGLAAAAPAGAYPLLIDYTGFSWNQSVGLQTTFNAVGVVDDFEPDVPNQSATYTFYLSNLHLSSVQDLGGGYILKDYSGGDFQLFQSTDPSNEGYDYGTFPTNLTSPSTFTDGMYWLGGSFSSFSLLVDTTRGLGNFSGTGAYDGGAYYGQLGDDTLFTFAGLTKAAGSGVPAGYEYRVDGQLTANVQPIPEPATLMMLGAGLLGSGLLRRRKGARS